jgi:AcrR family transcriptional regulator
MTLGYASRKLDGMEATKDGGVVSSAVERRRRNREEMTAAILGAARAVMREEGVAALNLQEVARRVGVRAPSLYEYFPSKAALYDALYLLGVRLYAERDRTVRQLLNQPGQEWEALHAAIEQYLGFAQECPELWRLVFERHVPGFTPSETSMAESRALLDQSVSAMTTFIERGVFRPGLPPERATDLFIAMLHGLAAAHMANEPDLPVGEGRFGRLIPAAVALFRSAWDAGPGQPAASADISRSPPTAAKQ